ncbi:fatty acid alpha-hydroxylase [Dimargaris verticillata]|uniref:Ceramide very long chain fatty acid hydroxylase n=1 Tax=Dimargaris verticillata TaxID=2761393 RepID=A0A9W8B6R0_9FUNG|nr:fatty acid alpha-hydroxylase [Dimargaris verticillata]
MVQAPTTDRQWSSAEVARHNRADSLWVSYRGKVFDLTEFAQDHPGGLDLLLDYAGQDVEKVMKDPLEHAHSDAAYDLLDDYCIGTLNPAGGSGCRPPSSKEIDAAAAEVLPATDIKADLEKEHFLDLSKPLFMQMVRSSFSKEFYMQQIHKPRYLSYPAPFFGTDAWLEVTTKTPWFVIPTIWLPLMAWYASAGYAIVQDLLVVGLYMAFGLGLWTLIEYALHRFVFHIEALLPDHPLALCIHFTLHGVHHYLPMDRYRLVMPPALGLTLAYPLFKLGHAAFPAGMSHAVIAGTILGYVAYDLTHYYLHHGRPFFQHLCSMKSYHLAHHYKNFNLGFGVTVKFWDRAFNTLLN